MARKSVLNRGQVAKRVLKLYYVGQVPPIGHRRRLSHCSLRRTRGNSDDRQATTLAYNVKLTVRTRRIWRCPRKRRSISQHDVFLLQMGCATGSVSVMRATASPETDKESPAIPGEWTISANLSCFHQSQAELRRRFGLIRSVIRRC